MRRVRARRSCHSVPATRPRMVARAAAIAADLVFLDMEDSVPPHEKGPPAYAALDALTGGWAAPTRGVRVNPVGSPWCLGDLEAVAGCGSHIDVILVPKIDEPGQVAYVCHLLDALEDRHGLEPGGIGVEVQIESARALLGAAAIAAACPPRVEALVFGPGDFAASLGAPQTMIGEVGDDLAADVGTHALFAMVVAARAHGLQAVDGPFGDLSDPEGLRRSAARARSLGCDGKWSVHPDQVPVLNAVFSAGEDEVRRAREILGALEGAGAARMGGEMVDEASRRLAEAVLRRAGGGGTEPPPPGS